MECRPTEDSLAAVTGWRCLGCLWRRPPAPTSTGAGAGAEAARAPRPRERTTNTPPDRPHTPTTNNYREFCSARRRRRRSPTTRHSDVPTFLRQPPRTLRPHDNLTIIPRRPRTATHLPLDAVRRDDESRRRGIEFPGSRYPFARSPPRRLTIPPRPPRR